jgi:hypothetical protein
MPTFNAADIIGKTLVARKTTDIVRAPSDDANVVYEATPGQSIGTVYSYLLPGTNRSSLYWQFIDENNKPYYVKHSTGQFDISTIRGQGVLTLEEKQEQAASAAETTSDKIFRYIKNGFLVAAAVYLAKSIIETKKK